MEQGVSLREIAEPSRERDPATVPFFGCGKHTPAREFTAGVPVATEQVRIEMADHTALVDVCPQCKSGVVGRDVLAGTGKVGVCIRCGRERR